jgi:hypothetical protein
MYHCELYTLGRIVSCKSVLVVVKYLAVVYCISLGLYMIIGLYALVARVFSWQSMMIGYLNVETLWHIFLPGSTRQYLFLDYHRLSAFSLCNNMLSGSYKPIKCQHSGNTSQKCHQNRPSP